MEPTKLGLWKCHPETLRVFGWCYAPNSFVAVCAELERRIKSERQLYERNLDEVVGFIARLQLEQTVMPGDARAVFPKGR